MVRDLESLIEYLYLKSINSDLLNSKLVINPRKSDQLLGKIVILNKIYEHPNLAFADKVIHRDLPGDTYSNSKNKYIEGINIRLENDVFVFPLRNAFYFGEVPKELRIHPCYQYLINQTSEIQPLPEEDQEVLLLASKYKDPPEAEESDVSKP